MGMGYPSISELGQTAFTNVSHECIESPPALPALITIIATALG